MNIAEYVRRLMISLHHDQSHLQDGLTQEIHTILPNSRALQLVHSNEAGGHDSHGMVLTSDGSLHWVLDRAQNVATVFDTGT